MISIKKLTYMYPEADSPALKDIDLEVSDGEFILITGATGSGKSTLLYCINGLIPHVFDGKLTGEVVVNGFLPKDMPVAEISRVVGTVFQNPESQIFMLKVEDDVAFGCENLSLPEEDVIKRRDMALKEMGLFHMRHAETLNLSGGMKQRLAISSVYAMGPNVFLFDEPTTDLDSTGRVEFLNIVRRLKEKGNTILLTEHQYEDFLTLADRVIVLEKGEITGFSQAGSLHTTTGRELLKGRKRGVSDEIDIQGVTFGYTKKRDALVDINLNIKRGELIAVCGDNGSGKTTLLKVLTGLLKPVKGNVTISGLVNPSLEELIGRVGFLFQNPDEQLFANSVEEEIMFAPMQLGKKINKDEYLKIVGFSAIKKRHPQTLSRGQRQLLAILSVMTIEPQILVLDEPTTGLDHGNLCSLFRILYKMVEEGKTVIFSTHHRKVKEFAQRVILMKDGRVIKDEIYK